jgi:hypothetical protein
MNSMRSYLNLRFQPSTGSRIARVRKSQTCLIGAVALCAAVLAASTPAFPATRNANANSNAAPPTSNGVKMAPTETAEEAAAEHQTLQFARVIPDGEDAPAMTRNGEDSPDYYYGYWTAYPFVKKYLYAIVAYNPRTCAEITTGAWYPSAPFPSYYGVETQGDTVGRLGNGACPAYRYTSRAIYYEWVYDTNYYQNDRFGATWRGAGLSYRFVFYLEDR